MRKSFFAAVLIWAIFLPQVTFGHWYGPFEKQYVTNSDSTPTNCDTDGTTDWGLPNDGRKTPKPWTPNDADLENPNWPGYYFREARVVDERTSVRVMGIKNYIICERWDPIKPDAQNISYFDGWTKEKNISVSVSGFDNGWSLFPDQNSISTTLNNQSKIEFQEKVATNAPRYDNFSDWKPINPNQIILSTTSSVIAGTTNFSATAIFSKPDTTGTAYKYRYRITDGAGNTSDWKEGTQVYKLDTSVPKVTIGTDIGVHVTNDPTENNQLNPNDPTDSKNPNTGKIPTPNDSNTNFLAGATSPIEIVYNNQDGSPITIKYQIENNDNPRQMDWPKDSDVQYRFQLPDTFTKVDNDRNNSTGGRDITLKIISITDAAWNVTNYTWQPFTFHVFADIKSATPTIPENTDNKIADGTAYSYSQKAQDKYGNKIIPATAIGRTIARNIQTVENKMFLDQKNRTWDTSVFVNGTQIKSNEKDLPYWTKDTDKISWNGLASSDWNYPFTVKSYTPTANSYTTHESDPNGTMSDPNASFAFNTWLTVKDNQQKIISIASKDLNVQELTTDHNKYSPMYVAKITWDLQNGWFIEGAKQNSSIYITKQWSRTVSLSSISISSTYDWPDKNNFTLTKIWNPNLPITDSLTTIFQNATIGTNQISTFLKQIDNRIVKNLSKIYFSTHLVYTLDWKKVTYNTDVIGKDSYHGNVSSSLASQYGVKILGTINNKNVNLILNNQDTELGNALSANVAANIKNQINRSIALATRNIPMSSVPATISDFEALPTTPSITASGVKGWIVKQWSDTLMLFEGNGGNITLGAEKVDARRTIVVRGMDLYITKDMYYSRNGILWVVVQKNAAWKWGNLYINTNVTNIVGSYVLDGSIMSSTTGTSGINVGDIATLKNQLYIFGSLLSQNTIGGSRANPLKCPTFVATCDETTAQKYDLNFLRRYYLFNNKPFGDAKIIGGGTVTNLSPANNLIKKFTDFSQDLAKYPVIIEHNPAITNNTPIGFDIYR